MRLALLAVVTCSISADLPVTVVFKGNPKARPSETGCVSWWGPNIIVTNSNTTIMCAACKPNARTAPITSWISRSTSAGRSWSAPTKASVGCGEAVYSRTSNTIFQPVHPAKAVEDEQIWADEFVQGSASCSPCCTALNKYCRSFVGKGAACLKCEQEHAAALNSSSACAGDPGGKMQRFCGAQPPPPGPLPPRGPPVDIYKPVWAHQLPQLTSTQLAKCEAALVKSTDEGLTFSTPQLLSVNNSLGPHYIGGGLNHGIQLRRGPHAGRLAMARRLDCPAAMGDHGMQQYFHSYVLYSDDEVSAPA
eukprot:COSAG01_NODE_616_length_14815_cov_8.518076_23_plen_306_part_00